MAATPPEGGARAPPALFFNFNSVDLTNGGALAKAAEVGMWRVDACSEAQWELQ